MALYLGDKKVKINLGGVVYNLNVIPAVLVTNGIRLVSSDDYTLKDSNGIYLTAKEVEQ